MEDAQLIEMMDQTRWLLNSGLANDSIKNQLFIYGSLVHIEVRAVEVEIDPAKKVVSYKIFVDKDLLKQIARYEVLCKNFKNLSRWRLQRFQERKALFLKRTSERCRELGESVKFLDGWRLSRYVKKQQKMKQKMADRFFAVGKREVELAKRVDALVKRGEHLDFNKILRQFIEDYCGPKWSIKLDVLDIATYVEGYEQSNQLPSMVADQ